MFEVPLLGQQYEDLHCPNCGLAERVSPPLTASQTRFHNCPRLHDLSAPLVPVTEDCAVKAVEREDYLNGESQAMGDDGKAYMAVRTDYADGREGRAVNAGLAHGEFRV